MDTWDKRPNSHLRNPMGRHPSQQYDEDNDDDDQDSNLYDNQDLIDEEDEVDYDVN